jgi:large subunit ribosomal protein L29
MAMEIEKIRNLTDEELVVEEHKAAEQIFRLRFQISSGQQDGVKKLRELKKDVARMKTIVRDRSLNGAGNATGTVAAAAPAAKPAVAKTVKAASAKTAGKTAAKPGKAAK